MQNRLQDKNTRIKAFLIHFGISLGILLGILGFIFYYWYPGQFILLGGVEGLTLLWAATLVLGPLLTLVIFNPGKKTVLIKLDLVLITMAQTACIAFGLWMIYQQRPLLQVLANDGVHVHAASELTVYQMDLTPLELPDSAPHNVVLDLPEDSSQIKDLKLIHELINRKPFTLSEEIMVPASHYDLPLISARIASIEENLSTVEANAIAGFEKYPDCQWLPLFSIHRSGFACYNPERGIVKISGH